MWRLEDSTASDWARCDWAQEKRETGKEGLEPTSSVDVRGAAEART